MLFPGACHCSWREPYSFSELMSFWTLSIVRYSKQHYRPQPFRNYALSSSYDREGDTCYVGSVGKTLPQSLDQTMDKSEKPSNSVRYTHPSEPFRINSICFVFGPPDKAHILMESPGVPCLIQTGNRTHELKGKLALITVTKCTRWLPVLNISLLTCSSSCVFV
jgi:hypothetical protein